MENNLNPEVNMASSGVSNGLAAESSIGTASNSELGFIGQPEPTSRVESMISKVADSSKALFEQERYEQLWETTKFRARDLASQTRNQIQKRPYLALAATVAGGAALGFFLGRQFKSQIKRSR